MEFPVFENDARVGTLWIWSQGLYTQFRARLRGEGKELDRLWAVDGKGNAAPLGLLEPRAGERVLHRSLTRLELQKLPPRPWTLLVLPADQRPPRTEPAGRVSAPGAKTEQIPRDAACPMPRSGTNWLRLSDGSLFEPDRGLLALPWGGGELPAGAAKIRVEGQDYWVFHT